MIRKFTVTGAISEGELISILPVVVPSGSSFTLSSTVYAAFKIPPARTE